MRKYVEFSAVTFCILFVGISSFMASVIYVPDEYTSLQEAVNATIEGDTVLIADGTYVESFILYNHGITLCSNYVFDSDSSHIENTILSPEHELSIFTI